VVFISQPPILFGHGEAWSATRLVGILAGLGSSCCAAGAFLSIKSLGNDEEPIVMSMWFHTVSCLTSIIPMALGWPQPAVWPMLREWWLLSHVMWSSFLGQLMLSRGFQLLSPSSAAAVNLTQVVHARVLSIVVLEEHIELFSILGSVLVVGGVLLAQVGKGHDRKSSSIELRPIEASFEKQLEESAVLLNAEACPSDESIVSDLQDGKGDIEMLHCSSEIS
jgi:drug/metabolite transporter (DMT)-like permease